MEYEIRPATQADIPEALELIHEFHEEALNAYGMFCDDEVASELMPKMVNTTLVMVMGGKIVGLISGYITASILSKQPLFQEMMWFVSKKHRRYGIKLMDALEEACRKAGIKNIVAGYMGDRKIGAFEKLYKDRGYRLLEVQYVKTLEGVNV